MTTKKRILAIATCSIVGIGAITATALVLPLALKQESKPSHTLKLMTEEDWLNNKPFQFNNNVYLTLNDALDDFLKKIGGILNKQFIGRLSNSDIESNGLVDIKNANFYKFDINRLSSAYQDANGRYTESYDKAIRSFINESNVVTKYYDYKGNLFNDIENAKISMDKLSSMPVTFYKVDDYNHKSHDINPLNYQDQLFLKKIAFDFIQRGGKYANGDPSPFNFISVSKYDITDDSNSINNTNISKEQNILKYSELIDIYNEFVQAFENNFYHWVMNEITRTLMKDNLISVSLTINPYSTYFTDEEYKPNEDSKSTKFKADFSHNYAPGYWGNVPTTQDYNFNVTVKEIKDGKEKEKIEQIKVLDSNESVNLFDFNEIYEIFTNRKKFEENFDMEYSEVGTSQRFEYAKVKPDLTDTSIVKKCFPNLENIKFEKLHGWPSKLTDDYECRILEPSDKFDDGGVVWHEWLNNSMITFGVSAYLTSDNKKVLLNEIASKFDGNSSVTSTLVNKSFNDLKVKNENNENAKAKIDYLKSFLKNKYKEERYYFTFSKINESDNSNYDIVTELKKLFDRNYLYETNIMHPEIQRRVFDEGYINEKDNLVPSDNNVPKLFEKTLKDIYATDYDSNKDKIMSSVDMVYKEYMTPEDVDDVAKYTTHVEKEYDDTIFAISESDLRPDPIVANIFEKDEKFNKAKDAVRILGLFEDGKNSKNRDTLTPEQLNSIFYKVIKNFTNINFEKDVSLFKNLMIDGDDNIDNSNSKYWYKLNQNSYNFFITYNDVPLYEINPDILTQKISFNNIRFTELETLINKWLNNQKDNGIVSKLKNDELQKFLDELFVNVSANVGFDLVKNKECFIYDPNIQKIKVEESSDSKNYIKVAKKDLDDDKELNENNNSIDIGELGSKVKTLNDGVNTIAKYYNKNLSKIKIPENEFEKLTIEKETFIDKSNVNNIVVLYKKDTFGKEYEDLIYGEVPSSTRNINISLTDSCNNSVLATTLEEWNNVDKRYKAFTTPAPIHLIYAANSIVYATPFPNLDNSSPNYSDSIDLVLENALRNYQIAPDKRMVMYQVKKGQYEPVENQVFILYQYTINQRDFYFDTLEHANKALVEYIKLNSYLLE